MNCHVLLLFFVLNLFVLSTNGVNPVAVILLVNDVVQLLKDTYNTIGPVIQELSPGTKLPFINNDEKLLLSGIANVNRRVQNMERTLQEFATATSFNLKKDISPQVRIELNIKDLLAQMSIINSADETYKGIIDAGYLENATRLRYERHTMEDFATTTVSHTSDSVRAALHGLHSMICPHSEGALSLLHESIFKLLANKIKAGEGSMCQLKQSPNQIISSLFNTLQMVQLKGFTMMQFSWMLLRLYNKGNFTLESRELSQLYRRRMVEQAQTFNDALASEDPYWRCDPKQHVKGETYLTLTKLLQGHILNEADTHFVGSCSLTCPYYNKTKQYDCTGAEILPPTKGLDLISDSVNTQDIFNRQGHSHLGHHCVKQYRCAGDVVECQFIASEMAVCHADLVPERKYNWISYRDDDGRQHIGKEERNCSYLSFVEKFRLLVWDCTYCFCLCDETLNSDRYFSLKQVLSSTEHNKVVTGIKFVKIDRIIHIQVQESVLEPHGGINQSLTAWQPVDYFDIADSTEGQDYMKMSYQQRAINLDDLIAPPGHIMTGVRFRMIGSHLSLEIRHNPIDIISGRVLDLDKGIWKANLNSFRTKISVESSDVPVETTYPSVIDSGDNQFLLFTHSDVKKDLAQTTVPYLDAQEVVPQPPVPLAGIGLYHKGQSGFGGFIGLKVFTYNVGDHVKREMTRLFNSENQN